MTEYCGQARRNPAPFDVSSVIERMCRAYWPSWDRMRPDHQCKWRAKMHAVLEVVKEAK